jgi:hypothetical protein
MKILMPEDCVKSDVCGFKGDAGCLEGCDFRLEVAQKSTPTNSESDEICAEIIEYSQLYQYKLDLGAHFCSDQYIRGILDIVKRKLSPVE